MCKVCEASPGKAVVVEVRTVLLVEQDLELVGEVVVERAVHALDRLLLRQLAVHPRASTPQHDTSIMAQGVPATFS